ncbi:MULTISPECIES: heme/hemin ABC transporter substrate-binding protein [Arthrobacter]|uniref:heme/hemin ABC transporter substrate-binding protein n=1 Tax=Arthrobacter TaxID=1663 RepID=UPI0009E9161F|nr:MULTISPECIES: ABC transporter substrate-binding protein [Arthrobacter]
MKLALPELRPHTVSLPTGSRGARRGLLSTAALLSLVLTGCAPVTPGIVGAASNAPAAPVSACTDGTAGKRELPAEWSATGSWAGATNAASHQAATGPTTAETAGMTLPKVASVPTPELPASVTSCDGANVAVTDVSRIVTIDLYGTLTEIVHGLGLGANVVGHDRAANFPEAANGTVVTPSGHDLNAEAITALDPTLILTDTTIGPLDIQQQLREIGIPVIFFDPARTLPGISHQINAVADALGVPDAGVELNTLVGADISAALSMVPAASTPARVAFLYVRGTAGVYLMAGPGSGADDMIAAAGAMDVGTDIGLKLPFTQLTSEALIKAAPDVLLLMTGGLKSVGGVDGLVKIQGIGQTPAGTSRRVVDIADDSLLGFGPRTGQSIKALATALHGSRS